MAEIKQIRISGTTYDLKTSSLVNERFIDGAPFDGTANVKRYATCTTTASDAAKVATITDSELQLTEGARVTVKFQSANTASSPTLTVDWSKRTDTLISAGSTGPIAIYWRGEVLDSSQYWQAGAVLDFVYNGTQWELVGVARDNNTTYSEASQSAQGLMSAADKTKLDGIALLVSYSDGNLSIDLTTDGSPAAFPAWTGGSY